MKYTLEELKTLIEGGNKAAVDEFLYKAIEKTDVALVQAVNKDVKSVIDSEKDVHQSKALETWKTNHLDALVDAEVQKRNPDKTPEQIEIEKLKQQIAASDAKSLRKELEATALQKLNAEKAVVPDKIFAKLIGEDEATTLEMVQVYLDAAQEIRSAAIESVYDQNGGNPDRSGSTSRRNNGGKDEDFARDLAKDQTNDGAAEKAAAHWFK